MEAEDIEGFMKVRHILQYCILTSIIISNIFFVVTFFIKYPKTSKHFINCLLLHKSLCDGSFAFYLLAITLHPLQRFLSSIAVSISGISTFAEYVTLGALYLCVCER